MRILVGRLGVAREPRAGVVRTSGGGWTGCDGSCASLLRSVGETTSGAQQCAACAGVASDFIGRRATWLCAYRRKTRRPAADTDRRFWWADAAAPLWLDEALD